MNNLAELTNAEYFNDGREFRGAHVETSPFVDTSSCKMCGGVDTYVLFIRTTLYTEDVNRPRYVSSRDSRIIQAKALLA